MIIYAGNKDFLKEFQELGEESFRPFKDFNFLTRIIFKFFSWSILINKLLINHKLFENKDEHIIIFDSTITKAFLKILYKNKCDKKLIFWYWNPVSESLAVSKIHKNYEVWSYSTKDCINYGLNKNSTFYLKALTLIEKKEKIWDIAFIGKDKNRLAYIKEELSKLQSYNLKIFLHITGDKMYSNKKLYKQPISYKEILNIESKSKAIFDYYLDNRAGMSLRPLESLLINVKLITNNIEIINEPLYNKNNVFILEHDDQNIIDFLDSDFISIDESIIDYYRFESWLSRFFKEG